MLGGVGASLGVPAPSWRLAYQLSSKVSLSTRCWMAAGDAVMPGPPTLTVLLLRSDLVARWRRRAVATDPWLLVGELLLSTPPRLAPSRPAMRSAVVSRTSTVNSVSPKLPTGVARVPLPSAPA